MSEYNIIDEKKLTQRSLQAIKRREELLMSAKKLFAENGYHATTTRSINQAIGMADGLIYHYFPKGKKQILEAIIEDASEQKVNGFLNGLAEVNLDMSVKEFLYHIGKIILTYATTDKELLIILLRENNLLENEFFLPYIEVWDKIFKKIVAFLEFKIEQGEIKKLNSSLMMFQYINFFTSFIIQKLFNQEYLGQDENEFLDNIIEYTLQTWT